MKSLDKLAMLTAKRAGILADLLGTEREIEQLCRNVASESVSTTTETLPAQKKRGRKPKTVLEESSTSNEMANSPTVSGNSDNTVSGDKNDRSVNGDGGAAPSGVPSQEGAEPKPRRGRQPKAGKQDEVISISAQANDLLQSMEPGVEMTASEVAALGYRKMICGDPSQPVVSRWINSTLSALAAAGHVRITVSSSGSIYTRVGG